MQSYKNIDEYLENLSKEVKEILENLRNEVKKLVPEVIETISYGIPTFKYKGKNLIHFAGHKSHIGFYPGSEAIEYFKDELKEYKFSKGTIQFSFDKPLPFELIKKIVKFRENQILNSKK